jgi:hypothetical protein
MQGERSKRKPYQKLTAKLTKLGEKDSHYWSLHSHFWSFKMKLY